MKNTFSLPLVIGASVIIAGGSGFFAGTKYQQSQQSSNNRQFAGNFQGASQGMMRNGPNGQQQISGNGGNRMGFRPVSGQIISSDDKSITVKMTDGSSKIVLLNDSTNISEATKVAKTALVNGVTVAVFGQTNSDGSVTAQSIQLNPEFRGQENNEVPPQIGQPVNGQGALPTQGL